jgi:hypothetical protein
MITESFAGGGCILMGAELCTTEIDMPGGVFIGML